MYGYLPTISSSYLVGSGIGNYFYFKINKKSMIFLCFDFIYIIFIVY